MTTEQPFANMPIADWPFKLHTVWYAAFRKVKNFPVCIFLLHSIPNSPLSGMRCGKNQFPCLKRELKEKPVEIGMMLYSSSPSLRPNGVHLPGDGGKYRRDGRAFRLNGPAWLRKLNNKATTWRRKPFSPGQTSTSPGPFLCAARNAARINGAGGFDL